MSEPQSESKTMSDRTAEPQKVSESTSGTQSLESQSEPQPQQQTTSEPQSQPQTTSDSQPQSQAQLSLTGKVAIVSGSSSGIGQAIAQELASRGANVVINYPFSKLKSEAEAVRESLATPGISVEADLSTTTGPSALVLSAVAKYGKVDILINNAALAANLPLEEHTLAHWDTMVNLNGRGTFLLTQATLPHLTKGSGRIVNVVSVSSRGPPPGQTIYAGTKGMVDSFTRCWAKELPPKYGCTVNAVSPGPTMTQGFADAGPEAMKILQPTIDATPVGKRMAQPEEIAYAVAMLCEEKARWINGAHVMATGGLFID